jgi:hypothetical protein
VSFFSRKTIKLIIPTLLSFKRGCIKLSQRLFSWVENDKLSRYFIKIVESVFETKAVWLNSKHFQIKKDTIDPFQNKKPFNKLLLLNKNFPGINLKEKYQISNGIFEPLFLNFLLKVLVSFYNKLASLLR